MTIVSASFAIDGIAIDTRGFFRLFTDTYGLQTVPTVYGILTFGLVVRVDEIWASMAFAGPNPITSWIGISPPSTAWTNTNLPTTVWTVS